MIKLTELKKAIKNNSVRNPFFQVAFGKMLFNYNNKIIVELFKVDIQKFYTWLQSEKIVNDKLELDKWFNDPDLECTFQKLESQCKDKYILHDTSISFESGNKNDKKTYKVFKSSRGLLKIDSTLISFLDNKESILYTNVDNNIVYIYNDYHDYKGTCIPEQFKISELNNLLEV